MADHIALRERIRGLLPKGAARLFSFLKTRHFLFAWHGSARNWHTPKLGLVGGAVGGLIFRLCGLKVPQPILDNPFWGTAIGVALCAFAGVVIVFSLRLLYAFFYFGFEKHGGLRSFLRKLLGEQMWPVVLMVLGIFAFFVLFGTGIIWFAANNRSSNPALVYDTEQKLSAIDDYINLLNEKLSPLITSGMKILSRWPAVKENTQQRLGYASELHEYASEVDALRAQAYALKSRNERYSDLYPILQPKFENQIFSGSLNLAKAIEKQPNLSPDAIALLDPDVKAFEQGIRDSIDWRDKTIAALLALRGKIAEQSTGLPAQSPLAQ